MPSASPSPAKRLSIHDQASSAVSLSSSGKPAGATTSKQSRPHVVSRHSRNVSHGRGLNNMAKKSMAAVYGGGPEGRHHRRSKSGTNTPVVSPRANSITQVSAAAVTAAAHLKRNSSHVILPKNRSHVNLRKNQSTNTLTALNRNLSRGALNKLGAPAEQKARQEQQQRQGVFDLGDNSSEDEEEAEWEDSTASPELTRNNSKVSTPARAQTPSAEPIQNLPDNARVVVPERTSSPPEPSVLTTNRSAPDLRSQRPFDSDRLRHDPALLQQNGRASRAPPAMVTTNAHSSQLSLTRNDSQRSLVKSANTSVDEPKEAAKSPTVKSKQFTSSAVGVSSSGSAGVSHFLPLDPALPRTSADHDVSDDDDESVSSFMANYKPLPSESPDRPKTSIHKARLATQPSRTQQKLELQRREVMRGSAPTSNPGAGMALSAGSSVSLHSRSHSKGRTRSMIGEMKAVKQEYENAVKQLTVVRRFRNPILESLNRLKEGGSVNMSPSSTTAKMDQKRPPSRHGRTQSLEMRGAAVNGTARTSSTTTPEDRERENHMRASKVSFASNPSTAAAVQARPGGGRDSRVTFQLSRQGSHEDILTTSQGSPEVERDDDVGDGLSPEEALIRRMWESRIHVA